MIDRTIEALISAAASGASGHADEHLLLEPDSDLSTHAAAKLCDAQVAGFEPEFSPHEAEAAGAFIEDALGEVDARDTPTALPRFLAAVVSPKAQAR